MFNFLSRVSLVAFISLTAFQLIHIEDHKIEQFKQGYLQLEKQTKQMLGLKFHQFISTKNVQPHAHMILLCLGYTIILLSFLSLFVSRRFTFMLGLFYFIEQLIFQNLMNVTLMSSFDKIQNVLMTVFILMSTFALSCSGVKVVNQIKYVEVKPENTNNKKK